MVVTRCVTQIDKRTALPLRIPKNGGGCTKRRPILDVHDVKQQKSQVSAHARDFAPRLCTDRQVARRARRRECARTRSIHLGLVAFGVFTGPSVPPAWWRRGVARRRLVRSLRSDLRRIARGEAPALQRADPFARSFARPRVRGAERGAIWAKAAHRVPHSPDKVFRQGGAYVRVCGKNQARRFIRAMNDKGFARLHAMHEVSFDRVMKKINRENCGASC